MSDKHQNFKLHDPALVDLADYGHRNGLKTRKQVEASMALELEAIDATRLQREEEEARSLRAEETKIAIPKAVGDLAVAKDSPTVVFLSIPLDG
jgi:hypothetical protein